MLSPGPIVLIEDDHQEVENITAAIRDLGVANEIIALSDADEAMEFLLRDSQKPLIIFCDIRMVKMDGLSLRKQMVGS